MAPPPLLALRDVRLTFGGTPLFEGVTTWIAKGDKTCLVGRNGSGKSTLLKVLAGEIAPDSGERFVQPGASIAVLPQDPIILAPTIADYVAQGLRPDERDQTYRVDAVLDAIGMDGARDPVALSGGEGRRAALARALVGQPDALLLDEPTNHLDLPTILWLEEWLSSYGGALVMISHDRRFLETVSKQTLWLERGVVRRAEFGFEKFPAWQDEVFAAEEAELARMNTRMRQEMHWLARGVTARRKRNMGRLRALHGLRAERAERKSQVLAAGRQVNLATDSGDLSGRLVIEAENVTKTFGDKRICQDFSTRILRGDRVGLIGPNGAGKTTLLRMLTGELAPDGGVVRLGTNLETAYFDQRRAALDPDKTVWDTLTDGRGDNVWVRGTPQHVVGYMKDFLFSEAQARTPVRALSGGERNRLLLAKLLAKPSNLLILDEPTNDLDMDTLDLLEEVLADYDGTLLVVSHDRDFLDRLVTSVIAVEGDAEVSEYVGGYSDYLRQRPATAPNAAPKPPSKPQAQPKPQSARTRLSFNDQRELDQLPGRIDKLTAEIAKLEADLADPNLYAKDAARFQKLAARAEAARAELDEAEIRWLELETKREEAGGK
ncbi:ATPase components of ABC transporters with duplicated ATPase domains [Paramagnetospirillum magnetotacticum MS-1]|uniref:ATP-binding protein Uup n=1 Tax=Paramagnetospirillum magnetotacticum MS-1 TaxID=272627 RepID=A0A0C2YBF0_PARME|nr:ATP-binding cassette domain-containing protein [Paramagnetospirillum magnetotacticum]KIL97059.1 ATPase components of ABC transporters with duplicated ATPase domains [Paramagnetospirillum magnetotacticum MS-1]